MKETIPQSFEHNYTTLKLVEFDSRGDGEYYAKYSGGSFGGAEFTAYFTSTEELIAAIQYGGGEVKLEDRSLSQNESLIVQNSLSQLLVRSVHVVFNEYAGNRRLDRMYVVSTDGDEIPLISQDPQNQLVEHIEKEER